MAVLPAWDVLLRPAMAERVSDAEHDDFGDDDALDEQEGAIGAEDAQRALNLAPPVERQYAGDGFDELKVLVRGCREKEASHHQATTMITKAPTSAAPLKTPRPAALPTSIMCRFMVDQRLEGTLQFGYRGHPLSFGPSWTE